MLIGKIIEIERGFEIFENSSSLPSIFIAEPSDLFEYIFEIPASGWWRIQPDSEQPLAQSRLGGHDTRPRTDAPRVVVTRALPLEELVHYEGYDMRKYLRNEDFLQYLKRVDEKLNKPLLASF